MRWYVEDKCNYEQKQNINVDVGIQCMLPEIPEIRVIQFIISKTGTSYHCEEGKLVKRILGNSGNIYLEQWMFMYMALTFF